MYLEDIQDYFQTLAEKNVDIAHGVNGRLAFFRLQGMGALTNLPNNLGNVVLEMERFNGRAIGEYDANKLQQSVSIRIGKLLEIPTDGDFETAISVCMGESYLIVMDIISKMKKDFTDDNCGWLKYVDFISMSWSEFDGPWLERHYGWDLNIPFKASFPAYRAAKWI